MFRKQAVLEASAGDEAAQDTLGLAACEGTRAVAVVGDGVVFGYALAIGAPVQRMTLPLPPGGRVVALGVDGPSAVTEDGVLWYWTRDERWVRVASLLEPQS